MMDVCTVWRNIALIMPWHSLLFLCLLSHCFGSAQLKDTWTVCEFTPSAKAKCDSQHAPSYMLNVMNKQ
jgi:hypothetical protein